MILQTEKQLLNSTQRQLVLWFLSALIMFAVLLLGAIYYAMKSSLLQSAYQEIQREWQQKVPEATDKLLSYYNGEEHAINFDTTSEDVASWVFTVSGKVIQADYSLARVSGSVRFLFLQANRHNRDVGTQTMWVNSSVDGTQVLLGIHPLYRDGKRLGTLISAYSLASMMHSMRVLVTVDTELGVASLIIIALLTYVLSRRTLQPIRLALQRQRLFVNDAAHELRTPLTILRGNLELAQIEQDPQNLHEIMKQSIVDVDYLSHVVADLTRLARSGASTPMRNRQTVDLTALVEGCIRDLHTLAKPRQVQLHINRSTEPLFVKGDPAQLRQLFIILVENAIKYNVTDGQVQLTLAQAQGWANVEVRDTGIGIPPHDLPHVFDRFYRSEVVRQDHQGSGIGLAIAAWIVEQHQGRIGVISMQGEGATFTITLPLATKPQ